MAATQEKIEIKAMIQSLYSFANVPLNWHGEANDRVAEIFGIMIAETQKCSKAFAWVPTPPGGRASSAWLVRQLGRGVFNHHRSFLSFTCARGVIYKWDRELAIASMGLSARRLPLWA